MTLEELIKLTRTVDNGLTDVINAANKPLDDLVGRLAPKITSNPDLVEQALQREIKKAALKTMRVAFPEATALAESFVGAATTVQGITEKALLAEQMAAETFVMAQTQGIGAAAQHQLIQLTAKFGANLEADLKKKLVRAVVGNAVKKAKTATFTAISGYQRGVQQAAYEPPPPQVDEPEREDPDVPAGRYFVYVGPDDRITRPFCEVMVGKAIPDRLVDQLRNAQNLPFRRFCGGFNCRHTLVPVNHRYVIARRLSVVDESDVSRANEIARKSR